MMRLTHSLAGPWDFQLDPRGVFSVDALAPDRTIPVPMPWQAAFPELQQYSGYAWYRRLVDIDPDWLEGEILLHFGAVDYWCEVFVNGQPVGGHEGGYTPFNFAIRRFLRRGANEIAVRVFDPVQDQLVTRRWPAATDEIGASGPPYETSEIAHGKQEWYINVGGIWQDVWLTVVPRSYIVDVQVQPDIHSGEALVSIEIGGRSAACAGARLTVRVEDAQGGAWQVEGRPLIGQTRYEARVSVGQPQLWSLDDPQLYTASVTLETPTTSDALSVRFGFREITTSEGRLLLNGEPLFLLSALDQAFYPETIYTVPSEEFLRDQFQKARELGLNCLRCHIKPPDPRYLDLADEMGILIWAELPSWRTFHEKDIVTPGQLDLSVTVQQRMERTLEELIRRDFNHPSLIIWTIVNEDWGTSLPLSAADRVWVAQMYERCKELDPTRLVVDNSPCVHAWGPNLHVRSDIEDFHIYCNIPDRADYFTQTIEQFSMRPIWTYSAHGDAQRSGQEPLILSEFGNWGMPSLAALRDSEQRDPSWFNLGPWWSGWHGQPGFPHNAEQRFKRLGLDGIWGNWETFARATQWHQFMALKFEIEAMRCRPSLAGYVITELSDIYWESNGLLDFLRNPKVFHEQFATINAPDVIVPQVERYSYWDDQELRLSLHVAHYSSAAWRGARLLWAMAGTQIQGELEVGELERGAVQGLGRIRCPLPKVERPQSQRLELVLRDADGRELARNSQQVLLLPAELRRPGHQAPLAVTSAGEQPPAMARMAATAPGAAAAQAVSGVEAAQELPVELEERQVLPAAGLRDALAELGYQPVERPGAGEQLAVTSYPDADLLCWVRDGGRLLYLSQGPGPFFWVQSRGGAYSGDWITSFSWLRPGIHRRLEVLNPLGLPFAACMPTRTILGLPVADAAIQPDLLAGMVSGWIGHPATHTVQFRYGQGKVIMTTFALEEGILRRDPVATAMFHDLLEHLGSAACEPVLAANI